VPTPVLSIRSAGVEDHEAIARLTLAAYEELVDAAYLGQLRDVAGRAGDGELLVAELGDQLVGAVTYADSGPLASILRGTEEASFRMLAVDPAARGRGAGRALAVACLQLARAAGRTRMVISTGPRMLAAHALYASLGFTHVPTRDWSPRPGTLLHVLVADL